MKKALAILTVILVLIMAVPFSANAASAEGYYTYEISGGQATIIDVDENISGYVVVPSSLGGYPVTTIGAEAFSRCSKITKIGIPGCVETIGQSAFAHTIGLTEAIFSGGVKTIGAYCFDRSSVVKIYLPSSVDTIGYAAWGSAAIFYEGTEEQLQAINRPNKGAITDIFRGANISYNQTIPSIESSTPPATKPEPGTEPDTGIDYTFDFDTVISWLTAFITSIINLISQLFAV